MATDVTTQPSSMGGGWALPESAAGREALRDFYGVEPAPLAPLGGALGYIVEPYEGAILAEHLARQGLDWGPGLAG